jgi:septation ring formation regulator EzrA
MRTRLTENDLNRIVKKVIKENRGFDFGDLKSELSSRTRRVLSSMEDYDKTIRNGDYKKASDVLDMVRRDIKRLDDVISNIKRKI